MRKIFHSLYRIISAPFRLIFWIFRFIFRTIAGFYLEVKAILTIEAEDTPLPDVVSRVVENPGSILDQLADLRRYLLRSVAALALATALAFTFNQTILAFLSSPLEGGLDSLVAIDVTEPVGTVMRVSLSGRFCNFIPLHCLPGVDVCCPCNHQSP